MHSTVQQRVRSSWGQLIQAWISMRHTHECVRMEEGREILQEIHEGVCGNYAASRTLVGKAFRSGFYWPTALADTEAPVRRCTNYQFLQQVASRSSSQPYHHTTFMVVCMLGPGHDRAFDNCP
jgi:hypothetical protein